ncbi:DUF3817 domain-containing protein [Micrococcoides hystricis]|uniref:DUF3817 domain-containing protein n=1 Tax=Micrococcoides hystricis TaxID=1572761 RepID=A0ABV6PA00_9MICC
MTEQSKRSDQSVRTEGQLPPPPPRPQPKRRFGGTQQQIRSALTFYRFAAYITGIFLLLLVAEMVAKYAFGLELFAGGTAADGSSHGFGFAPTDSVEGGLNLSIAVLIVHGWLYVIYLIADFRLWSLMNWPATRLLVIALGGVVPFLSFIVEKRVHKEVLAELSKAPEAIQRY